MTELRDEGETFPDLLVPPIRSILHGMSISHAGADDPIRCTVCGETFERETNRGPVPKYCSGRCRQDAFERRKVLGNEEVLSDVLKVLIGGMPKINTVLGEALAGQKINTVLGDALAGQKINPAIYKAINGAMPKVDLDRVSKLCTGLNADVLKKLQATMADMMPKGDIASMIGPTNETLKSVMAFDQAERLAATEAELSFQRQRQLKPVDIPKLPIKSDRGGTAESIAELQETMATVVTVLVEIRDELRQLRTLAPNSAPM